MPARISAWAVYDVFATADAEQVFVGVVTDTQWRAFCETFDQPELWADSSLATNTQRVEARPWLIPRLREVFLARTRAGIVSACEQARLPFAPIVKPEELFDDPHLKSPGATVEVSLPDGRTMPVPALPLEMNGRRFGRRLDIPRVGEHGAAIAQELGYTPESIAALAEEGVLALER
jgi:crotonobetainyl-CoA:carnitine CoA-transferase CaiB-like acyl-CoA transferase